jgi:hypothetical protein
MAKVFLNWERFYYEKGGVTDDLHLGRRSQGLIEATLMMFCLYVDPQDQLHYCS